MIKRLLPPAIVLCLYVYADAATWTIHGCKDNFMQWSWEMPDTFYHYTAVWDWNWDQLYPNQADSGTAECSNGAYASSWTGYSDVITESLPDSVIGLVVFLAGPAPDYGGDWIGVDMPSPGEWWGDFGPGGIKRLLSTQPADFGKWAWDGSVNPSWVEPIIESAAVQHGKKLGHYK